MTVLLPDDSLSSPARRSLAEEAEVWRRYVASYGLPGDRIIVANDASPVARAPGDPALKRDIATLSSPQTAGARAQRVALARRVADRYADADQLLVAVSDSPGGWNGLLPGAGPLDPARGPKASGSSQVRRSGGLVVRGGHPASASGGPAVFPAPAERGAMARALAESWVRATGGRWQG